MKIKRKNVVLFVDDEIKVLSSIRRGLIEQKYKKIFVDSGEKALEVMDTEEISVIVTDMRMPGMNGLELLKEVRRRHPKTIRIVLSGYTQLPQVIATINNGDIFKFLPKPWALEEQFIPAIDEAIEYYNFKIDAEEFKKELEVKNTMYQNLLKTTEERMAAFQEDISRISTMFEGIEMIIDENFEKAENSKEVFKNIKGFFPSVKTKFIIDEVLKKTVKYDDFETFIRGNLFEECIEDFEYVVFVIEKFIKLVENHFNINSLLYIDVNSKLNNVELIFKRKVQPKANGDGMNREMLKALVETMAKTLGGHLKYEKSNEYKEIEFLIKLKKVPKN